MFKPVSVGNICSSPMLGPFLWPPCVYCRALSSHAPSIKAPSIVAYLTYKGNLFFTASEVGGSFKSSLQTKAARMLLESHPREVGGSFKSCLQLKAHDRFFEYHPRKRLCERSVRIV